MLTSPDLSKGWRERQLLRVAHLVAGILRIPQVVGRAEHGVAVHVWPLGLEVLAPGLYSASAAIRFYVGDHLPNTRTN